MGSLAAAGALRGTGEGLIDVVKTRQATEQRDLDRAHDVRIQEMRAQAQIGAIDRRGEIQSEQYQTMRTDTRADLMEQREYESSLLPAQLEREDYTREDEQSHEMDIEIMKQYQKFSESGGFMTKDGKWEMKVLTEGEMLPNGMPVETDTFVVREPGTPFSYVQEGMHMLPHNYTAEEKETALAKANNPDEIQNSDTKELMNRAGTDGDVSSEFMRVYGYLPAEYFRKVRDKAAPQGFERFRRQFRQPANMPMTPEREAVREQFNQPEDPDQAFSPESEARIAEMDDQEYLDALAQANGKPLTEEQIAEVIALGMLPSQRKLKQGGGDREQPATPRRGSGGVLSDAVAIDAEPLPAAPTGNIPDALRRVGGQAYEGMRERLGVTDRQPMTEEQMRRMQEAQRAEGLIQRGGRAF